MRQQRGQQIGALHSPLSGCRRDRGGQQQRQQSRVQRLRSHVAAQQREIRKEVQIRFRRLLGCNPDCSDWGTTWLHDGLKAERTCMAGSRPAGMTRERRGLNLPGTCLRHPRGQHGAAKAALLLTSGNLWVLKGLCPHAVSVFCSGYYRTRLLAWLGQLTILYLTVGSPMEAAKLPMSLQVMACSLVQQKVQILRPTGAHRISARD